MRQFKFRAWDKEDERMITHTQDFIPLIVTNMGVMRLSATHDDNLYKLMPRERFELMQWTGLKDCNGVDIYEGDILKGDMIVSFNDDNFGNVLGWNLIDFDGEPIAFYYGQPPGEHDEVIGNIYENPELLKGTKNDQC